jgi:hypothetical protein
LPRSQPVHATLLRFGVRAEVVIGNYMSGAAEEALAKMGRQFLTPVIGFGFQDTTFANKNK